MDVIKTPKVDNVRLLDRFSARKPAIGTLYLTATHLIFVDPAGKKETWMLHMHITSIDKLPLTTAGSPLLVRTKTFMCVTFIIPRDRDCQDIYTSLLALSQPARIEDLYAFHYAMPGDMSKSQGWDLYSIQNDFLRMGVPNGCWLLTNLNKEYELCDTYPRHIYVPASATTPVLVGSSKFRSRGRLPALSYLHRDNQAAICRSSQPLAGFSARCVEDEQMLQAILKANPNSKYMYVVDTRPKINAMANKAAGKGYESENFYSDIKFQFWNIENIHVMRGSLQKLVEVCGIKNPSMGAFLSGLENSGWLKHIKIIMETSAFIAKTVDEGVSVLVHCSDGWDRTAQTCSLSSIMLDPYYRTIQGFQALIEKEWLSFGHKFTDRCRLLEVVDPKEESPVFTQFIDSVWQLSNQFPCAFQFNDRFLLSIHDHVYSCQFGTFIGNCEKDRLDLRLAERTYSLWGYMSNTMGDYLNPLYKKDYEVAHPVLLPNTSPQCFRFWRGMYNRFENGVHPRESISDVLGAMKDHSSSLEDHVQLLEKRIQNLGRMLGRPQEFLQQKFHGLLSAESLYSLNKILEDANLDDALQRDNVDNDIRSDCESGFEDGGSSQMSKSVMEDGGSLQTSTVLCNSNSSEALTLDQLAVELSSVAISWRSLRGVRQCRCASPFEHFTKKYHCWKCGEVYCMRCIDRHIPLPGHYSQRPVPVCRPCYKEIKHSPSTNSFQDLQDQLS